MLSVWCLVPGNYPTARRLRPLRSLIEDRTIAEKSIDLILSRYLPMYPRTQKDSGQVDYTREKSGAFVATGLFFANRWFRSRRHSDFRNQKPWSMKASATLISWLFGLLICHFYRIFTRKPRPLGWG